MTIHSKAKGGIRRTRHHSKIYTKETHYNTIEYKILQMVDTATLIFEQTGIPLQEIF